MVRLGLMTKTDTGKTQKAGEPESEVEELPDRLWQLLQN